MSALYTKKVVRGDSIEDVIGGSSDFSVFEVAVDVLKVGPGQFFSVIGIKINFISVETGNPSGDVISAEDIDDGFGNLLRRIQFDWSQLDVGGGSSGVSIVDASNTTVSEVTDLTLAAGLSIADDGAGTVTLSIDTPFTASDKTKLDGLSNKFLGTFVDLAALTTKVV